MWPEREEKRFFHASVFAPVEFSLNRNIVKINILNASGARNNLVEYRP